MRHISPRRGWVDVSSNAGELVMIEGTMFFQSEMESLQTVKSVGIQMLQEWSSYSYSYGDSGSASR